MDTLLYAVSGLCTLALSIMGFVITTRPPKGQARKRLYEWSFIMLAVVGSVATFWSFQRSQAEQEKSAAVMARLGRDLAQVNNTTAQTAKGVDSLLSQKTVDATPPTEQTAPSTKTVSDAEKVERTQIVTQLRDLYILSHDNITPQMMAGLELPPVEWLNEQLAKYKKPWRIKSANGPTFQIYELKPS